MTIWVGPQSAGAANGTSWANRYGSLNDAEDDPVAAGETVWVGPGVYREMLTVDVSGGAGTEITYIGDVTGENTDGVGGVVRITGSDDDATAARASCITAADIDYRSFRGFAFDLSSDSNIFADTGCKNWIIEDCVFLETFIESVSFDDAMSDITIRRCMFLYATPDFYAIEFTDAVTQDDTTILIENCYFLGCRGIRNRSIGGVIVRNCVFQGSYYGIRVETALTVGQTLTVNTSIFTGCDGAAVRATAVAEHIEDYNTFFANTVDRDTVNVGVHSTTYPALFQSPILYSGVNQVGGFQMPWSFGNVSEWSLVRARQGDGNQPLEDLHGVERPHPDNRKSWGPIQFAGVERSIVQAHSAVASELHYRPSRKQFFVPTDGSEVTVSAWVYREANYRADRNPGMVLKQPGAVDRDTRDAGAVAQWNQITDTFTPNATPPWFMVELVNDNYYSTTTSTTTATSTTQTETSTSTTTSTTTLNVWFDDIGLT